MSSCLQLILSAQREPGKIKLLSPAASFSSTSLGPSETSAGAPSGPQKAEEGMENLSDWAVKEHLEFVQREKQVK